MSIRKLDFHRGKNCGEAVTHPGWNPTSNSERRVSSPSRFREGGTPESTLTQRENPLIKAKSGTWDESPTRKVRVERGFG